MLERLQKIISLAGVASRRAAEELIRQGRVSVNGKVVTELGTRVDPERDHVKVNGKLLRAGGPKICLLLYKPRGVVSTLDDPQGRATVRDFLKRVKTRVYPVGRLDLDSEGLLLLTNDGELAHRLMHPRYKVGKTYRVKVRGVLDEARIRRLEQGVALPPLRKGQRSERTAPATIRRVRKSDRNSWIEVTLYEGRKRQVRRMLEQVRHPVVKLKRIRYGFLDLEGLAPGDYRRLTVEEMGRLRELVQS